MKKQIILGSFLAMTSLGFAQQWVGALDQNVAISRNGNVGIGGAASTEKLYVNGTVKVTGEYGIRLFHDGLDTYKSNLYLANIGNTKAYNFQLNASGTSLDFYTYGGGNWTKKISFTETGLLGIGVTNPQAFLHVSTPVNSTGTGLIVEQLSSTTPAYALITRVKNNSTRAFVVENTIASTVEVFKVLGDGKVYATEVNVQLTPFPDYVFAKNYKLMSLDNLESYINKNHHLPNVPSANEVETNGANLGELSKIQMEKIEELTLYIIELKKEIDLLKTKIK